MQGADVSAASAAATQWYLPIPDCVKQFYVGDRRIPGMFGREEGAALYHLVKQRITKETRIADGGTFLGRSTAIIAQGVVDSGISLGERAPIVSYDRFRDMGNERTGVYKHFLANFVAHLAQFLPYIEIRQGDFARACWDGDPIALMFVDIAKTQELHNRCITHFYPYLIGSEAILFHQDFHNPWLPYLHAQMQMLAEYFDILEERVEDSCIFVQRKAIPKWMIERVIQPMSNDLHFRLFDEMIARFRPENRHVLYLVRCLSTHWRLGRNEAVKYYENTILTLQESSTHVNWPICRSQVEQELDLNHAAPSA